MQEQIALWAIYTFLISLIIAGGTALAVFEIGVDIKSHPWVAYLMIASSCLSFLTLLALGVYAFWASTWGKWGK